MPVIIGPSSPSPGRSRPAARRGFTLLELIISVALVLVLMLAVTKIFSITSTTIGASQGIASATRDARAAQAVFARDIGALASDSPFIWIRSDAPFSAFRNAADEAADVDGLPLTIDLNDDGKENDGTTAGENTPGIVLSTRRHRLDRFAFFARDRFTRQTGNTSTNTMVSGLSSSEAMIYYGPIALPNTNGTWTRNGGGATFPTANNPIVNRTDDPNNYYASQWNLGRFAPILIMANGYGTATQTINEAGITQEFYPHNGGTNPAGLLSPYSPSSSSINAATNVPLTSARYDLFGTDIATTRTQFQNYIDTHSPPTATNNWRVVILNSLFQVNPFVIKPIQAATAARQVPFFVSACSQFVVEYAGDFVEQDATGALADVNSSGSFYESDGKIDFVIVNGSKQIKWYGYPRDMDGDLRVDAGINSPDVTPVSDFAYINNTPLAGTFSYNTFEWYGAPTTTKKLYTSTPSNFSTYYAAWGPNSIDNPAIPRPKMYRITLSIDRPEMAGRSADPQTFEYVFNVP